jgi:ATP-dependent Clp protease ATP-binding subunit ClpA
VNVLEKFSAMAIQAINAAREEALRVEFEQVDTEHMLLGLSHETRGVIARAMQKHGVDVRKLRMAVEQLYGRGYSMIRQEDLMFSPASLRALAAAAQANPTLVESQDVLVALLREPESKSRDVMRHLGVDPDAFVASVEHFSHDDAAEATGAVLPAHFSMRLLTDRARGVIDQAYAATRAFGHTIVGTEQLLTGLLADPTSMASQVLVANSVDPLVVEAVAARVIGRGSGTVDGRLSLSRWVEQVLEAAWASARRLKHERVGTGHVLLGLTDLDVGGALYILDHLDINLGQIRYDVEQAFAAAPGDPEPDAAYPVEASDEGLLEGAGVEP